MTRLRMAYGLVGLLTVALITLSAITFRPHQQRSSTPAGLPGPLATEASFPVYYFNGQLPQQLTLEQRSASLANGVLIFQLHGAAGVDIAVTEQPMGSYSDTRRSYGDHFSSAYGSGTVQENMSRTTGEMFTNDKTWIIANSTRPIGKDDMRSVLEALAPYKP